MGSQVTWVNKGFYRAVTGGVIVYSAMTGRGKGHTWTKRGKAGTLHSHHGALNPKACATSDQSSTVQVGREWTEKKHTWFIYPPLRHFHFGKFLKSPGTKYFLRSTHMTVFERQTFHAVCNLISFSLFYICNCWTKTVAHMVIIFWWVLFAFDEFPQVKIFQGKEKNKVHQDFGDHILHFFIAF